MSGGDEKAGMDLGHVLDGMFETGFDGLPEAVRREVARRFHPFRWDDLSPKQRRTLALAADGEAPGREDEFSRHWSLYAERAELLRQVSEWWLAVTPTATDKATQEDQIAVLRKRVEEIDEAIAGIAPAVKGRKEAPVRHRQRSDALTLEIETALTELGAGASPSEVLACLAKYAGKPGSAVVEVARQHGETFVIWQRSLGQLERLTRNSLRKRLANIRSMRGQNCRETSR